MKLKLLNKIIIVASIACTFLFAPKLTLAASYSDVYYSNVNDFFGPTAFDIMNWNVTIDATSTVNMAVRAGDATSTADASWTAWQDLGTTSAVSNYTGTTTSDLSVNASAMLGKRYFQYRVIMTVLDDQSTTSQAIVNNVAVNIRRGEYWSSSFNSGSFINGLNQFAWTATTPGNSSIEYQFRTSLDNASWTAWCGQDNGQLGASSASCNSSSFFVANNGNLGPIDTSTTPKIDQDLWSDNNDIYIQYRAFLFADYSNPSNLPTINSAAMSYAWDYYTAAYVSTTSFGGSRAFHYSNITFLASTTDNLNWIEFRLRTGDSASTTDGSWTEWQSGVSSSTNLAQGRFAVNFSTTSLEILDGNASHKYVQYEATLKTSDVNNFPVLHDVQINTYTYNSGWLISNWYDTQDASAEMGSFTWLENSSTTASHPYTIAIQARTASSSAGNPLFIDTLSTDWFGPDGTSSTYFTATNTIQSCISNHTSATTTSAYCPIGEGNYLSSGGNDQLMQYMVYLDTDGYNAPVFNNITMSYGINVAPSLVDTTANSTTTGQNVRQWKEADGNKANDLATLISPNVDMTGKSLITFSIFDADTNGMNDQGSSTARTPGYVNLSLQYCDRADGNCSLLADWKTAATSSFNIYQTTGDLVHDGLSTSPGFANSTTSVSVGDASSTPATDYRILFDPKQEGNLQNKYLPNFHYRVVADDAEGANRYGYLDTGTSTLDTLIPVVTSLTINASTQLGALPSMIYATANDDTASGTELMMRDSFDQNFTDNPAWRTFDATSTKLLPSSTSTVYVLIKDAYGNIYSGQVTPPAPPEGLMLADISNPVDSSYKLFVSWKKIFDPIHFNHYVIWRAASTTICGDLATDAACYETLDFSQHLAESIYTNNFFADADLASTTHYYYKVTMEDNDGNISRYLDIIHDNPDGQGGTDITAPILSNAQVIATTTQTATIRWDTDELSKSLVYFLPQADYEANAANNETDLFLGARSVGLNGFTQNSSAIFGPHSVTINRLTPNTVYYYKLSSEDPSGNIGQLFGNYDSQNSTTTPLTFQTKNGPEINSAIQIKNITNTSAAISWQTTMLSDSAIVYATSTDNINQLVAPVETKGSLTQVTDHEVTLTGLLPNTSYLYYVASADTDGNQAVDKNIPDTGPFAGETLYFSFTTDHDVTAPALANTPFCQPMVIDSTGQPGLIITSRTTEPTVFSLSHGTTSDNWNGELASTTDLDYNQTARLDNLQASTTYYFQYQLFDASANAAASEIYSCNTLEPMVAKSIADVLTLQLIGKIPEDEVGQRIASSALIMLDETAPNDPNDATSTLWVQLARQGWVSLARATNWVLASTTEALLGMIPENGIIDRIASTSDELISDNTATSTDATSTTWVRRARESWIPEAQKEQHSGTVYTEAEMQAKESAARAEGNAAGKLSSSGGGILIVDKTDKVAPIISDIKVSNITATSARVSWLTNEISSGFVKYGADTAYSEYIGFSDLFANHYFDLDNLEPKTTYHFSVQSADGSGNITTSKDSLFITPEQPLYDIALLASSTNAKSIADKETLMNDVVTKAIEVLKSVAGEVSLGALQNSLLNQYDALEQLSKIIPGPVLSGEPSIETTPTTATINWHTDKPANSMVAYTPSIFYSKSKGNASYIQLTGEPNKFVADHSVKIIGLKPETFYHYQIRSKAKIGPESFSRDFTFRTKLEALEIMGYTTDILSADTATFKWLTSALTDSEIKVIPYHGTNLAVDEAKTITDKGAALNHEITFREFAPGVVYQVALSGQDTKGTRIEKIIYSFSTTKDDLPPEITNIQTESALAQSKDARVQTIITWETNEPTISQIKYAKGVFENEENLLELTPVESAYTKKHTSVITKFDVGEVYSFRILSTDSGGNQSISSPHIILTPRQKEGVFELIINTLQSTFGWLGQLR